MGNESLMLCGEEALLPWLSPLALLRRKPWSTKIFASHSLIQRGDKTKSDEFRQLGRQPGLNSAVSHEALWDVGAEDVLLSTKGPDNDEF